MSQDRPLLDVAELASLWGVTPRWIYRQISLGELAHVRVGRFVRFRQCDIEAYLQHHAHGRRPAETE